MIYRSTHGGKLEVIKAVVIENKPTSLPAFVPATWTDTHTQSDHWTNTAQSQQHGSSKYYCSNLCPCFFFSVTQSEGLLETCNPSWLPQKAHLAPFMFQHWNLFHINKELNYLSTKALAILQHGFMTRLGSNAFFMKHWCRQTNRQTDRDRQTGRQTDNHRDRDSMQLNNISYYNPSLQSAQWLMKAATIGL